MEVTFFHQIVIASCLFILPDDNNDILAATLSISYCTISSVIMITLYTYSVRFFRKSKRLSDARAVSMIKMNIVLQQIFFKLLDVFKAISDDLLTAVR